MSDKISFTLDGQAVEASAGETIWQCAERAGIDIPHLCYTKAPDYRADGNCRVCMVEIEGERVLAASCIRQPSEGMVVNSANDRATTARKMVMELLVADQPARESSHDPNSELWHWAEQMGQTDSRFPARQTPVADNSHTAMSVNLDACIHCTRCVRACREVQVNDVIGMAGRGVGNKIVFDFDDAMGESSCVACGECVQACPTGALMPAGGVGKTQPDKQVDSVCPYCGVGCQLTFNIKDNKILSVEGRDGPSNSERLCVKGRFGFDYINHDHRLTKPLIRRDDAPPKTADIDLDPANPLTHFREASWDEALDFAAAGLKKIRDEASGKALAGFGSAKGSNEEAYLFQKIVRAGFGSNNVDHCTFRGGVARDHRLRRGYRELQRSAQFRRHHRHRRPPHIEPPGSGHLPQERRPARRQTGHYRSARLSALAPRQSFPAIQTGTRRGTAERDDACHRERRPL